MDFFKTNEAPYAPAPVLPILLKNSSVAFIPTVLFFTSPISPISVSIKAAASIPSFSEYSVSYSLSYPKSYSISNAVFYTHLFK